MFRGGDYVDDPKFNNPAQIRNTLDISVKSCNTTSLYWNPLIFLQDITGAQSRSYAQKPLRDNMNVSDINGLKAPVGYYNGV